MIDKIKLFAIIILTIFALWISSANAQQVPYCQDKNLPGYESNKYLTLRCLNALPILKDDMIHTIHGDQPIEQNGKVDFFIFGDGLDEDDINDKNILAHNAKQSVTELLMYEPFIEYQNFFNVHWLWLGVPTSPPPPAYCDKFENGVDYSQGRLWWHTTTKVQVDSQLTEDPTCAAVTGYDCFYVENPVNWLSTSIVDNTTALDPLFVGTDYLYSTTTNAKAHWKFRVPEDGRYRLLIHYTDDSTNSDVGASYLIYVNDVLTNTKSLNQSFAGEGGLYSFEGMVVISPRLSLNDIVEVKLENMDTLSNKVIADAVTLHKYVPTELHPTPEYKCTPFDSNKTQPYDEGAWINHLKLKDFLQNMFFQGNHVFDTEIDLQVIFHNTTLRALGTVEMPIEYYKYYPIQIPPIRGVLAHEEGHALGRLTDEFSNHDGESSHNPDFSEIATSTTANNDSRYDNPNPIPWEDWIEIPTFNNGDPHSPTPTNVSDYSKIGLFPSGVKWHKPTYQTIMKSPYNGEQFSKVDIEQIIKRLHLLTDMIQPSTQPTEDVLINNFDEIEHFALDLIPLLTQSYEIRWELDGTLVQTGGQTYDLDGATLTPGVHKVIAIVKDNTPQVKNRGDMVSIFPPYWGNEDLLEEKREWTILVDYENSFYITPGISVNLTFPETREFRAFGFFTGGVIEEITDYVEWVSLGPWFGDFLPNSSLLYSISPGSFQISGTFNLVTQVVAVDIASRSITALKISPDKEFIPLFTDFPLTLKAIYDDGSEKDISKTPLVQWCTGKDTSCQNPFSGATVSQGEIYGTRRTILGVSAKLGSIYSDINVFFIGDWGSPACKPYRIITEPLNGGTIPGWESTSFKVWGECSDFRKFPIEYTGYYESSGSIFNVLREAPGYPVSIEPQDIGTQTIDVYFTYIGSTLQNPWYNTQVQLTTYDDVPPVVTLVNPIPDYTNDPGPYVITVDATDNWSPVQSVIMNYTIDGTPYSAPLIYNPGTGFWDTTIIEPIVNNNVVSFTVTATDRAGNTGQVAHTFTVDTLDPIVTLVNPPTDTNTDSGPYLVTASVIDNFPIPAGQVILGYTIDGIEQPAIIMDLVSGNFEASIPSAISSTRYTFEVRVTDVAGNTDNTPTQIFSYDLNPPEISNVELEGSIVDITLDYVGTTTPTITATVTDAHTGVGDVTLIVDGVPSPMNPIGGDEYSLQIGPYSEGQVVTYYMEAIDVLGNLITSPLTAPGDIYSFKIDTIPPTVTFIPPQPQDTKDPLGPYVIKVEVFDAGPIISGGINIFKNGINQGLKPPDLVNGNQATFYIDAPSTTTFFQYAVAVSDAAGNLGVAPIDALTNPPTNYESFWVDFEPPIITNVTDLPDIDEIGAGGPFVIFATVNNSIGSPLNSVEIKLSQNNGDTWTTFLMDETFPGSGIYKFDSDLLSPPIPPLPLGTCIDYIVQATDEAGNTGIGTDRILSFCVLTGEPIAFVVNQDSSNVSFIDTGLNQVIDTVPLFSTYMSSVLGSDVVIVSEPIEDRRYGIVNSITPNELIFFDADNRSYIVSLSISPNSPSLPNKSDMFYSNVDNTLFVINGYDSMLIEIPIFTQPIIHNLGTLPGGIPFVPSSVASNSNPVTTVYMTDATNDAFGAYDLIGMSTQFIPLPPDQLPYDIILNSLEDLAYIPLQGINGVEDAIAIMQLSPLGLFDIFNLQGRPAPYNVALGPFEKLFFSRNTLPDDNWNLEDLDYIFRNETATRLPALNEDNTSDIAEVEHDQVASTDINLDGYDDIIFFNGFDPSGGPATIRILINNNGEAGYFVDETSLRLPGGIATSLTGKTGDVNGDGRPDLVFLSGESFVGPTLKLYLNSDDPLDCSGESWCFIDASSNVPWQITLDYFFDIELYDINRDGCLDIFAPAGGALQQDRLYINDCSGNFTLNTSLIPAINGNTSDVVFADFDGDTMKDIFMLNRQWPQGSLGARNKVLTYDDSLSVYVLQPDTVLPSEVDFYGESSVDMEDLDGDGDMDLVISNTFAPVVLLNTNATPDPVRCPATCPPSGDPLLMFDDVSSCSLGGALPPYIISSAIGDINGDTFPDIVMASSDITGSGINPLPPPAQGEGMFLYLNDGCGLFIAVQNSNDPLPPPPANNEYWELSAIRSDTLKDVALIDVEKDTDLDMVVAHQYDYDLFLPVENQLWINDPISLVAELDPSALGTLPYLNEFIIDRTDGAYGIAFYPDGSHMVVTSPGLDLGGLGVNDTIHIIDLLTKEDIEIQVGQKPMGVVVMDPVIP